MRKTYLVPLAIVLSMFAVPSLVGLLSNWLWFQGVGFEHVFATILSTKLALWITAGLFSFLLIYLNLKLALRLTRGRPILIHLEQDKKPLDLTGYLEKTALGFSLVIGFFAGLAVASSWRVILEYFNATSFNTVDPIFGRDISFYFFTLPFIQLMLDFLLWIAVLSLAGTAVLYLSRGKIGSFLSGVWRQRHGAQEALERGPRIHFLLLLFSLVSLLAVKTYFVKIPELLYSGTGPFTGASFTDLHATLPVLNILSVLLALAALACLFTVFREGRTLLVSSIGLYLAAVLLGGWAYPLALQKFVVEPNELQKESPYIVHNIAATQTAFKLDTVAEHNLEGEISLTMRDIQENEATIKNVRLWDRGPLLDTFGQMQEIRTYYNFLSIDNDRYQIDGDYRQVLLSSRELDSSALPQRNFINERLTFTHGYGLTLSPVNEVTEEGLPVLFVKNLPPVSSTESLQVDRPEVYYGELTTDYVVVKTKAKEFDYPAGEENIFTDYQGQGGVQIDSLFRKLLMTLRFNEVKLLLSDDITEDSRIMYHRSIQERVKKVLPFLELDQDPYLVIRDDGSLAWIQDAYTVSDRYPYSERRGRGEQLNYIRNSVKAVVSPYDGAMRFYIAEPNDPVIQTYEKIFDDTFLPLSAMPDDLRRHLRYPEDIFALQTLLYTVYHMEEPQIFYNKEDKWQIPVISEGKRDSMIRHIIMKLPNEEREEYILMIPFTPQGKDNLAAWMVARSDGEHYGTLAVYRFPKQKLVFGPQQIINRINQDSVISQQISLWDQRGSQVNQGPLLVIPIEKSLLYVRPLYLRAAGGKIPELKRVIVAHENRIAMEETLDKALERIFSGPEEAETPREEETTGKTRQELTLEARQHYQKALQAQRDGNWTLYGEEIEKLGEALEKLK